MLRSARLHDAVTVLAILGAVAPVSAATGPRFDPVQFFAGRTEGRGTLKIVLTKRQSVVVHCRGRIMSDGALVLDQTVIEGDKPPATRQWTFRPAGPGRFAGTLSDAAGPIAGSVTGSRLHLHFQMRGGIVADQRLDLAADGASAQNHMTFRKFGVVVGTLDETIRRGG